MTDKEEMKLKILDYVKKYDGISFAELERYIGTPMDGELAIDIGKNIFIWSGVSRCFFDSINELRLEEKIQFEPVAPLAYMIDGGYLDLPIVKKIPKNGYKEPHWAAVCIRPGNNLK